MCQAAVLKLPCALGGRKQAVLKLSARAQQLEDGALGHRRSRHVERRLNVLCVWRTLERGLRCLPAQIRRPGNESSHKKRLPRSLEEVRGAGRPGLPLSSASSGTSSFSSDWLAGGPLEQPGCCHFLSHHKVCDLFAQSPKTKKPHNMFRVNCILAHFPL